MAAVSALDTIYSSGTSWNGRTSTGAPQAVDPLPAHSSAASKSAALMTQKPPSCSLVSANGPSVVTTWPPWARTTVAVDAGWRPPANTQAPADWSSALKASTALYACCVASSEGVGSPSTMWTASRYCFMTILPSPCPLGRHASGPFIPVHERGPPESTPRQTIFGQVEQCRKPARMPRSGPSQTGGFATPAGAALTRFSPRGEIRRVAPVTIATGPHTVVWKSGQPREVCDDTAQPPRQRDPPAGSAAR